MEVCINLYWNGIKKFIEKETPIIPVLDKDVPTLIRRKREVEKV